MSQIRNNKTSMSIHNYDEPPTKKLISEADIFIKELAKKQTETQINLQRELNNPKEFTKAIELIPLAQYNPGTSSLSEFQETAKHFEDIESLKAAGLLDEDIKLFFDNLKGEKFLLEKHKNMETSLLKQRLKEIHKKVQEYEDLKLKSQQTKKTILKNYEINSGLSVKPNSLETILMKFALANKVNKNSEIPLPIDNIKEIEKCCFEHLKDASLPSISNIRRKSRKLANRIIKFKDAETIMTSEMNANEPVHSLAKETKWDIKESSPIDLKIKQIKTYTCKPQNYYTIRKGEIVKLEKEEVEQKGLPVIKKLTIEEIRRLPKFQNYHEGNPSNVLYLKNISNSLKIDDLQQLLKKFEEYGNITYKLMEGRMKGQAFITFPNEIVAGRALEEINGVLIKDKPIIVQYGNKRKKD